MLPVATAQRDECRDNRLANWVDGAPAARLEAAAATLRMRLHTQRLLHGVAADGCPHEVLGLGLGLGPGLELGLGLEPGLGLGLGLRLS